jgi:hypothetical protein
MITMKRPCRTRPLLFTINAGAAGWIAAALEPNIGRESALTRPTDGIRCLSCSIYIFKWHYWPK